MIPLITQEAGCVPPDSAMNYFWPSFREDGVVFDGKGTNMLGIDEGIQVHNRHHHIIIMAIARTFTNIMV